jgi:hypothetical protein
MHRDGNCGISLFPPGTPMVTGKTSAYNRTSFVWSNTSPAQAYRIYRADQSSGPFQQIATVTPSTTSYTDYNLKPGWQYFYEVGAVYETNTVLSSPFAILSQLNNNLVANGGFEEDGNSHWDKWYGVAMTNMFATTNEAFQGRQSMEVLFQNQGNNDSISQFNQYGIPDATVYTTPGAFYSYGGWFKSGGISQPSQHWLTWTSSKTGYDTNTRPSLPWPFYFTPNFVAGTEPTPWTYINRTFQLPAGFPNMELVHSFSFSAPGSGSLYLDNVFFRQIPDPASTSWTTLVPFGATWRYYTNVPPANWFAPTFNDSSWPSGKAKFGAGTGPTNVVTRVAQHVPKYYFRTKFNVPSTDIEEFLLSATCTDNSGSEEFPLRLFLNGAEVQSTINTVTSQGNETRYFDLTPFASMLVAGTNTVGIIVSNYWSTWDDVAFDVRLQAMVYHALKPNVSVQCPTGGSPALCVQSAPGTIWQIQSCDNTPYGNWQFMQLVTNVAGGAITISDTGQNGRTAPGYCRSRFYRLVPY